MIKVSSILDKNMKNEKSYVEFVIYPFSFSEFIDLYRTIEPGISDSEAFQKYLVMGGMLYLS